MRPGFHRHWPAAAMLAVLIAASPLAPRAQEGPPVVEVGQRLDIEPHRLVFGPDGGRALIDLRLPASTARFSIRVEDRVMLEDGRIMSAEDEAGAPYAHRLQSARNLVTVTPERAALNRGENVEVTVKVAAARDMPPGEYRAHVTMAAEPPDDTDTTAGVKPRYNLWDYAVPVIVRVGPVDARAGIADVVVIRQALINSETQRAQAVPVLSLQLQRLGRSSIFGDVLVIAGSAVLGRADGVAVYPEVNSRQVQIPLIKTPAAGERLTIVFVDRDATPGAILAEVSAPLAAAEILPA